MPKCQVTYFDCRGLAEPIRQMLVLSDTPFQDVRIPFDGLPAEKKEELGLEWGVVPVLEIDGRKLAQSYTIMRYLARKFHLMGKNEDEEIRCDEIVEAIRDFTLKTKPLWENIFGSPDPIKLEKDKKQFSEVDSPVHLSRFDKLLAKQEKIWLVGDNLTWADIVLVHYVTHFQTAFDLQLTKDFPGIEKLIEAVQGEPKIKAWIEKQPKTQF